MIAGSPTSTSASTTATPPATFVNGDSSASVNAYPNGLWSSPAAAAAHGSGSVVPNAPADAQGCPSGHGCGWVIQGFTGNMGQWANNNGWFGNFAQSQCNGNNGAPDSNGTWNDCVSSIDDTKACTFTWWVDVSQQTNPWVENPGGLHGTLDARNNAFSSDSTPC